MYDSYFGMVNEQYFAADIKTRRYWDEQAKEKTARAIAKARARSNEQEANKVCRE